MKIAIKLVGLLAVAALGWTQPGFAQQAPKKNLPHPGLATPPAPSPAAYPTEANAPPQPGWASRCTSAVRAARTRADFSCIPVYSCAAATNSSSSVIVVRMALSAT